ncbi:MAG: hypothetical protein ACFE0P_09235 [Oceanicaulis sp.]
MRLVVPAVLAALVAGPAFAQGPETAPGAYEEARGGFGAYEAAAFDILKTPLGAIGGGETARIEARLGADWAAWAGEDGGYTLVDLATQRRLTIPAGDDVLVNTSLYAEARRRLDIYAGLSRGGTEEMISFGEAGEFDRTWLEAAMGIAATEGVLTVTETEAGFEASLKGEPVFAADYGAGEATRCEREALTGDAAASALILARHAAPLHPDVMTRLAEETRFPCAFDFVVYSPESPEGRRETWVLADAEAEGPVLPSGLSARLPQSELIGAAGGTALAAARGEAGDAPDAASFFERAAALRAEGDLAGAFLTATQEAHHFGPCPDEAVGTGRLACAELRGLTAAGIGDADVERVLEGVAALRDGDPAQAVNRLSAFIDREDAASAAARILVAEALLAWGREGLESRPDLDPAGLLAEAIAIDPFAADAYGRLGRLYLQAGAPHAAWVFFDLGRALPGREATPALAQAGELETRLEAVAPAWTGRAAARESSPQ